MAPVWRSRLFGPALETVQVVRPLLHHLLAFIEVGGSVVGPSKRVANGVTELMLDENNRYVQHFIKYGSCRCPESVGGRLILGKSHAAQGRVIGVVAHASMCGTLAGKEVLAGPGERSQGFQNGNCLLGQGDNMGLFHLHPGCGDLPDGFVELELGPFGGPQLPRPAEKQGKELEGALDDIATLIGIYCPEELHEFFRSCWGGMVPILDRGQCPPQVSGDIAIGPLRHHGVTKKSSRNGVAGGEPCRVLRDRLCVPGP